MVQSAVIFASLSWTLGPSGVWGRAPNKIRVKALTFGSSGNLHHILDLTDPHGVCRSYFILLLRFLIFSLIRRKKVRRFPADLCFSPDPQEISALALLRTPADLLESFDPQDFLAS